jgi:hypothetical protein
VDKTNKPGRKGPPKSFNTFKEAKEALANLADSLSTHSFSWPAAALRSYLKGTCKTLDEAFGLPERAPKPQAVKKKAAAAPKRARPAPRRKSA